MIKKTIILVLLFSGVMFQELSALQFTIFFTEKAKDRIAKQQQYIQDLEARNRQLAIDLLEGSNQVAHLKRNARKLEEALTQTQQSLAAEKKSHGSTCSKFKRVLIATPGVFLVGVIAGGALVFKLAARSVQSKVGL